MSPREEAERRRRERCPEQPSYWGKKEARERSRKGERGKGWARKRKARKGEMEE